MRQAACEVERLLKLKQLQLYARNWKVDDIHLEGKYIVMLYRDEKLIRQLVHLTGKDLRIADDRAAYLVFREDANDENALFSRLNSVLQTN